MNPKTLQTTLKDLFSAERLEAPNHILTTLVSGVATVLTTRLYLEITGFPQIGPGGLHITHVLWGGIIMLASGLLNLSYHGKLVRFASAILLGVGFGLFIDEAGKFLTRDNDYFFQPAAIIVYLSFLTLFYLYNKIKKTEQKPPKTLLYQALEQIEEAIEPNFDKTEKQAALNYLNQVIQTNHQTFSPFAKNLKKAITKLKTKPDNTNLFVKVYQFLRSRIYRQTFKRNWFVPTLFILFTLHELSSVSTVFYTLVSYKNLASLQGFLESSFIPNNLNLNLFLLQTLTETFSIIFTILGLNSLNKNKLKALRYLSNALIIKILLTRPFSFYFEQFSATVGVLTDIILLVGVNRLILEEKFTSSKLKPSS